MGIESVLIACLPSAITGFCFWCIEQKIQKQSKKLEKEEKQRREAQDKREKLHEQQELFLVQGVNAAIALGEATARAVQRIPDAHCATQPKDQNDRPKKDIRIQSITIE